MRRESLRESKAKFVLETPFYNKLHPTPFEFPEWVKRRNFGPYQFHQMVPTAQGMYFRITENMLKPLFQQILFPMVTILC